MTPDTTGRSAFLAVLGRELRLAIRHPADALAAVLFFLLVAALFPFGVGPAPETLARLAPGALLAAALLAALLPLDRLWGSEAEDGSRAIAANTGLEVVVVRPPLVYGPGVKANFAALMRAVRRGLPLPLKSITDNRRSFVALDNLVDLLVTCLDHPAAANQTFLVSDGEDLSTTELLYRLGRAMNCPPRLFPVPSALLYVGAALLGRRGQAQRLLGNLQIDIDHTRKTLGWEPPVSVDEGLRRAAEGFRP